MYQFISSNPITKETKKAYKEYKSARRRYLKLMDKYAMSDMPNFSEIEREEERLEYYNNIYKYNRMKDAGEECTCLPNTETSCELCSLLAQIQYYERNK